MNNTLVGKPKYTHHRIEEGAPVTADATDLVALLAANSRAAIDCAGFKTVKGFVILTGGTTPTITLSPLEHVKYTATDGAAKDELHVTGANTSALSSGDMFEFTINGGRLFSRIHAVTGSPTKVEILLAAAESLYGAIGADR